MNINELRNGNYVLLNYGNGRKDVCKIELINIEERKATLKVLADNANIEIDSPDKWAMLEAIPFKKEFLKQLEFIKDNDYVVFGLPDNGAYVKFLGGGNDIIVRKEKGEWVLITRKDKAFYGCESLENIVIPASVKNIGDRAFYGCNSLKKVILPTRFKGKNAEIFNYSCEITYKDMEITYSKNKYFANKISANPQDLYLTDFKIKDDILVKYKGKDSNLIIPYGIIGIKSEAFCGCELLESITIPSSVTHIGKRIFANCNNFNHIIVEKYNQNYFSKSNCIIKKQSKTLIAGCNSSTIPKDIKAIGSSAFAMCRLLKRVSIPSGVTSIGDNAFFECVSLNKITIPTKFKGQEERLGICKDCKITYLDDDDEIIYSKN